MFSDCSMLGCLERVSVAGSGLTTCANTHHSSLTSRSSCRAPPTVSISPVSHFDSLSPSSTIYFRLWFSQTNCCCQRHDCFTRFSMETSNSATSGPTTDLCSALLKRRNNSGRSTIELTHFPQLTSLSYLMVIVFLSGESGIENIDIFLHILQLVSTCETGVEALGAPKATFSLQYC